MKFCIIHQFCFGSLTQNVYDTPNFKKAIDKSLTKVYNGIVNSKGAADDKSAALFWFIALIPYTKGCMKSQDFCAPLFYTLLITMAFDESV